MLAIVMEVMSSDPTVPNILLDYPFSFTSCFNTFDYEGLFVLMQLVETNALSKNSAKIVSDFFII